MFFKCAINGLTKCSTWFKNSQMTRLFDVPNTWLDSQTILSWVQFVICIMLISAKQKIVKQLFLSRSIWNLALDYGWLIWVFKHVPPSQSRLRQDLKIDLIFCRDYASWTNLYNITKKKNRKYQGTCSSLMGISFFHKINSGRRK